MKKKRRFKKRYIPVVLLLLVLGCNALGLGDMVSSKEELEERFAQANIKNYSVRFLTQTDKNIFLAEATNLTVTDTSPVFIFVHGTPGALSNSMAYLLDSILLERGIVVAYDRPGFGLSYRAEEMILDEQVAGLERVMAEYAGHEIYLIGHSYGAPVILQAAMGFSRQVAGIVWVGGIVEHAWREDAWWRKPLNYPPTKWLVPKSMVVSNREIINLQANLEKLKLKWKDVTCPVVILQGDKDWLADKSNATFADSMLVNATFKEKKVIKNASHFFYFSKTHFVVDALEKISSFADK